MYYRSLNASFYIDVIEERMWTAGHIPGNTNEGVTIMDAIIPDNFKYYLLVSIYLCAHTVAEWLRYNTCTVIIIYVYYCRMQIIHIDNYVIMKIIIGEWV